MEDKYVMRQVDNLIYFVSLDSAEDFSKFLLDNRLNNLLYISDVVIDADDRSVIKSRYF